MRPKDKKELRQEEIQAEAPANIEERLESADRTVIDWLVRKYDSGHKEASDEKSKDE